MQGKLLGGFGPPSLTLRPKEITGKSNADSLYKLVFWCSCVIIFFMLAIVILIIGFMIGSLTMENETSQLLELNKGAVSTMEEMKNMTHEMEELTRAMKNHLFAALPPTESFHFMHTMYQLTKDLTPSTVDGLIAKYQRLSLIVDSIEQRLPSYFERFGLILDDVENITTVGKEVAANLKKTHSINLQY